MYYAVNLADLASRDTMTGPWLVRPVAYNRVVVDAAPGNFDGNAVLLDCPEEQAEAIVQLIRVRYPNGRKGANSAMRCYVSKTGKGGWRRL